MNRRQLLLATLSAAVASQLPAVERELAARTSAGQSAQFVKRSVFDPHIHIVGWLAPGASLLFNGKFVENHTQSDMRIEFSTGDSVQGKLKIPLAPPPPGP